MISDLPKLKYHMKKVKYVVGCFTDSSCLTGLFLARISCKMDLTWYAKVWLIANITLALLATFEIKDLLKQQMTLLKDYCGATALESIV